MPGMRGTPQADKVTAAKRAAESARSATRVVEGTSI
jgi:hypothetical protein